MEAIKIIRGKRILIVDDEEDVLKTLVGPLSECKTDTATSFEGGRALLESGDYDAAVDIMGVRGFDLLEVTKSRDIPTLMLTAHALSEDSLRKSAENGASYFVPKDEIYRIEVFIADVIEAKEKHKNAWVKWFDRLGGYYDRRFVGPNRRERERDFWEEKLKEFPGV